MSTSELLRRCVELANAGEPIVVVTLVEATGSTPQDTGSKMVVTRTGRVAGTVGGGQIEAKAIDLAQGMLEAGDRPCVWVDWNLKADVGMTCGGRVKLVFEFVGDSPWHVVIFGAGHVAQALAQLLATLPCQITCVDPRSEWLAQLPPGVRTVELTSPAEYVNRLPSTAQVLCMTQGHRSDLPVLEQILKREASFAFVGVIGSRAKAAVLRKDLAQAGVAEERLDFHCPVGMPIGSNHPGEIAVSIAAQLIEVRDSVASTANHPKD